MQGRDTITIDEAKQLAAKQIDLGRSVHSLLNHHGWKIFMAVFETKRAVIMEKEDYDNLEDFRADRRSVKLVENLIEELKAYVEDADGASQLLQELADKNKADNQTPESILSIDSEESTAAEG